MCVCVYVSGCIYGKKTKSDDLLWWYCEWAKGWVELYP